ncbi:MAG: YgiT-type zinc finger protein [Actinobacteria bacterium]|nr:YgiT-type zinc finger protein [Actinomycetota bacterium]
MKCVICKTGETKPGKATVTLNRNGSTVVFKDVPAEICTTCGEDYTDEEVTERLLELSRETAETGVEVAVHHYVA